MIVVWILAVVAGLTASALASDRALRAAESLGHRAGLSPFIIGLTIVSIGTDLPEIANCFSAAAAGRGDLAVGDATGSAATQITFVLGVLLFIAPIRTNRMFVSSVGGLTVVALLLASALMADGQISNFDGLILMAVWVFSTALVSSVAETGRTSQPSLFTRGIGADVAHTLGALAIVGAGAALAVWAFANITDDLGVPEYVNSFFVLSVGTSLPEMIVDGKALRRGAGALALGDLLGSSLVDSTLSVGIGPALFSVEVSDEAAQGTLIVAGVVALAILVLLTRREHRWTSGVVLIGLYLALFPLLLA